MTQGAIQQNTSSSKSTIKPKASQGLQNFMSQKSEDSLVRLLVTNMPTKTASNIRITNTSGLKEALCVQAGLSFKRIKSLKYIHEGSIMEIVFYAKDMSKIKEAISDFKHLDNSNPFMACKFHAEASWHLFLNQKNVVLKKKEISRLQDDIFKLSLTLFTSKYSTFFNKLSDVWIKSLKVLNPKLNVDIFKAQVSKKVQDALKDSFEIDLNDLDTGNITDLEDIHEDFAAFQVAFNTPSSIPTTPLKRSASNSELSMIEKEKIVKMEENKIQKKTEKKKHENKPKSSYFWSLQMMFYLYFIFQFPIVSARIFHVHFNEQVIKIDSDPGGTVYNLLVSMLARGHGYGRFSTESTSSYSQHLNSSLHGIPKHIWYTNCSETDAIPQASSNKSKKLKFGGINIRSVGSKFGLLNRWLIEHDFDFLFSSECNLAPTKFTPANFILFNPSNSKHGCGIMYNEIKYHHGNLTIAGDEHHVILHLMSSSILFVYKPPTENAMCYYDRLLQQYMDKDLIILGDFNINMLRRLSSDEICFFDRLAVDGYTLYDTEDEFTFKNHIGESKVDLIMYKDTSSYRVLNAGTIDTIQNKVTDHKMLFVEVEYFDHDPVFIMGKRTRWKYNNFKNDDNIEIFQHNLSLNEIKSRTQLHEYLFYWEFGKDWKTKKKNCNLFFELLVDLFVDAAKPRNSIGITKQQKFISTSHLAEAAEQTLMGRSAIADDILKEAKRVAMEKNQSKRNKLETKELFKVIKSSMHRKFSPKQSLNMFKCDEYIDDWKSKWKLSEQQDDIENHYPFDKDNDKSCLISMNDLLEIIPNLPHGKSPGEDLFINEFLQHSTQLLLQYLVDAFNLILKTYITPSSFHKNLIIPIHKGKNQIFHLIIYYRPIALSSILKKLFELCIKSHLLPYLNSGSNQYDYKPYYCTLDDIYHFQ